MNPKNGQFRVLLILLPFIPLTLGVMWLVGGRTGFCVAKIRSHQSATSLRQEFNDLVLNLNSISLSVQNQEANPVAAVLSQRNTCLKPVLETDGNSDVAGGEVFRKVSNVHSVNSPTAKSESGDRGNLVDPCVLKSDEGFVASESVKRKWIGKTDGKLFFEETDENGKSQVVCIEKERVSFVALTKPVQSSFRTIVSYSFEINHTGLRRIYGKFLEKACEKCHEQRLLWICSQLEKSQN